MKQGSNPRRGRNRGGGKRQSRNSNFDSNGPEGRVRGTAQQVFEKYVTLARDAQSAGDRIASENFFQHAEHYYRIMNADGGDNARGRRRNGEDFHNDDGPSFTDDDQPATENQAQAAQEGGNGPGNGQGNGSDGNGQHRREPERAAEASQQAPQQADSPAEISNEQAAASQDDAPEGEQQQASEINP